MGLRKLAIRAGILIIALLLLQAGYTTVLAQNPSLELISVAYDGTAANEGSFDPSISADGRYVAFVSQATNLVANDTGTGPDCGGNCMELFVRDRQTGQTTLVSRSDTGEEANDNIVYGVISANGQWVVFETDASASVSNLVPDMPYGGIVLHSLQTGLNSRMDVTSAGSGGGANSFNPSISGDGRFVAFESAATNLVPNDPDNCTDTFSNLNYNCEDIFLHDTQTGETSLISVSSTGAHGNGDSFYARISADGRYIAFTSSANNLVPNDTNGQADTFVYDRLTRQTTRLSVSNSGAQGFGNGGSAYTDTSADGRFVAFLSAAPNLVPGDTNGEVDAFVRDRQNNVTSRVSISSPGIQGNNKSYYDQVSPAISDDGRFTAFVSLATNMVAGDTNNLPDVFVHDSLTRKTVRLSVSDAGEQGDGYSDDVEMNGDGRFIVFGSSADNLVPGYENSRKGDIYLAYNTLWTSQDAPTPDVYTSLPVTLTWSPVSGAVAYEVQMGNDTRFNGATSTVVSNGDLFLKIDTLADGVYYWRVRAKNSSDTPGVWSAVQSFTLDMTP